MTVTAFVAQSQSSAVSKDTMCMPVADALFMLEKAQKTVLMEAQERILREDRTTLMARVDEKDAQIRILIQIDSTRQHQEIEYKTQIDLYTQEKQLYENRIKAVELNLRRQKRKTRFIAFIGTAVAGGLTYLYLKK